MMDTQLSLRHYVLEDIRRFLLILVIGLLVGLSLQHVWPALFLAVLIFLLLQCRSMYLLYEWIRYRPDDTPPELTGIWGSLLHSVYRSHRREKRAQSELLSVIDRAQASVSALEEAVILIDAHDHLEWWNPSAEKLLGLKMVDRGRNIRNIVRHPDFIRYFEDTSRYPDGIKLNSWISPDRYIQCELTLFGHHNRMLIAYDVTRLHNLEQMRKDFVDNISHELRTPLTVLTGYLEVFSDQDDLNPRWKRGFEQMMQQTRRMNALVNDLLLLSRLENEGLESKSQIINMPALLGDLFDDAQAYNSDYGHALNLSIDSHMDLLGSEMEISSAFGNLITNAIKYTPKGGVITIGWADDGEHGYFSVQDNGIGIEPYHIPRLTERFYRVDSARSRQTGGTGLGLAIVKHVLAQHDAYLQVESKTNQGSIFRAVFPKTRLVS
jgi:two-component system phosphate regulon sensor histidine kinase PhoR